MSSFYPSRDILICGYLSRSVCGACTQLASPIVLIPVGECLPERLLIFDSSPVHCHGASLECEALDSRKEFDDSPAEICACWMPAAHDGSIGFHIEVSPDK